MCIHGERCDAVRVALCVALSAQWRAACRVLPAVCCRVYHMPRVPGRGAARVVAVCHSVCAAMCGAVFTTWCAAMCGAVFTMWCAAMSVHLFFISKRQPDPPSEHAHVYRLDFDHSCLLFRYLTLPFLTAGSWRAFSLSFLGGELELKTHLRHCTKYTK